MAPGQQRFQPHSAPMTTYGSPAQPPAFAPSQWQAQNPYQTPYQQSRGPVGGGMHNTIPYAFGQLPSSANPADPKSQHPIPGSFNRHLNPKIQSFVPGGTGLSLPPPPISQHGSPHQGSPHHGSPRLNYSAFPAPAQQQYNNGMGYNMARQGSNNSLPSYHASPHIAHRPMIHPSMVQGPTYGASHGIAQGIPQAPLQSMQSMSQNGQVATHLPNYGNSSTLPPKPPPGV